MGPLPKSNQWNTHVVVVQDFFTKWLVAIPTTQPTALVVAKVLWANWLMIYSPMKRLLSDNGTEFANHLILELCATFSIKKIFTVPHHPQSNGSVERMMRTITGLLRPNLFRVDNADWDTALPSLVYAYNVSVHAVTQEMPFFIWCGHLPNSVNPTAVVPRSDISTVS